MALCAAFRIHISHACKELLDDLGGYKVDYRGETELKVRSPFTSRLDYIRLDHFLAPMQCTENIRWTTGGRRSSR